MAHWPVARREIGMLGYARWVYCALDARHAKIVMTSLVRTSLLLRMVLDTDAWLIGGWSRMQPGPVEEHMLKDRVQVWHRGGVTSI